MNRVSKATIHSLWSLRCLYFCILCDDQILISFLFLFLFIYFFVSLSFKKNVCFYFILLYNTVLVLPYIDMTQRDVMGREVGGGFMFGNACTPMVDSCQNSSAFKKNVLRIRLKGIISYFSWPISS